MSQTFCFQPSALISRLPQPHPSGSLSLHITIKSILLSTHWHIFNRKKQEFPNDLAMFVSMYFWIYLNYCRWRGATDCKYLSFHHKCTILKVTTAVLEKESTIFSHLKINAKKSSVLGEKFMLPVLFPSLQERDSPCLTALTDPSTPCWCLEMTESPA